MEKTTNFNTLALKNPYSQVTTVTLKHQQCSANILNYTAHQIWKHQLHSGQVGEIFHYSLLTLLV